ncbi:hypothetical protein DFJ43DRAFT_238380 [Lentinula guzmanii]|uniref:Secreted peptide n=1 Tax=Lentinula guzmanii TaxID=2804957 RepID=A0AA38N1P4_9AGAR|nr:hypothetical protein DFJ43DRAFT_238380 [Lentinula guzmanii]
MVLVSVCCLLTSFVCSAVALVHDPLMLSLFFLSFLLCPLISSSYAWRLRVAPLLDVSVFISRSYALSFSVKGTKDIS